RGADSAQGGAARTERAQTSAAAAGQTSGAQVDTSERSVMIGSLVSWLLIGLVRGYQVLLRPLLPPVCRFTPSCSEYFIQAVRKYGPMRGAWRGVRRICRCHPWHPGGYDPP